MSAANNPLDKSGEPVTWNFKLLAQHDLGGFRRHGRRHGGADRARTAAASSGWRTRARRRISPASTSPIRASRKWWCRPTCRSHTCARTRSSLRQHHGGRLSDARKSASSRPASSCSIFRCRKSRSRSRSSTARARHSRGVHQLWFCDGEYVHMASGAPRLQADPSARRPVLSLHRRAQSVEAGRGRPLVDAGHAPGRQ